MTDKCWCEKTLMVTSGTPDFVGDVGGVTNSYGCPEHGGWVSSRMIYGRLMEAFATVGRLETRAEKAETEVERLRRGFGQLLRMYPDHPEYLSLANLVHKTGPIWDPKP